MNMGRRLLPCEPVPLAGAVGSRLPPRMAARWRRPHLLNLHFLPGRGRRGSLPQVKQACREGDVSWAASRNGSRMLREGYE